LSKNLARGTSFTQAFPSLKFFGATTFCKSKTRRCLQQAFFQESDKQLVFN
jgi:hypothetical protein